MKQSFTNPACSKSQRASHVQKQFIRRPTMFPPHSHPPSPLRALFCPSPTNKFFKSKFPLKIQSSLIKSETFHNKKLTSIRAVRILTIIMFVLTTFFTQNRKLLISSSRMPCFIGNNSVKKVCISNLICHHGNKFKIEGFWFVIKSFSLIFQK